jgi:hypothetical protein
MARRLRFDWTQSQQLTFLWALVCGWMVYESMTQRQKEDVDFKQPAKQTINIQLH